MHKNLRPTHYLIIILLIYAVLGIGYAVRTPAWQAPDEPAHYNYIAQVAAYGCCPVIEMGDWDQPYLSALTSARFDPELLDNFGTIQYEDHQPPLYYLTATPLFALSNGNLTVLRLWSLIIGAGVVVCAYLAGRLMRPDQPQIALGAAAFVAWIPQHLAILTAVTNDPLAELLIGITLIAIIRYLKRDDAPQTWMFGILIGLGLLTKVNTLFLSGVVGLAILARWWLDRRESSFGALVRDVLAFVLPALLIGGVWWLRNISVYGFPDIFGLGAHDLVVVGQQRTAEQIALVGFPQYLNDGIMTTFNSFWGQFGWMGYPLQPRIYTVIAAVLAVALAGIALDRLVLRRGNPALPQRLAWGALILTVLLAFAQFVYYNLEFLQFQGRYLFPALIPLGVGLTGGLDAWRQLIERGRDRLPFADLARWIPNLLILLFIPLNIFVIWRILPQMLP